MASHLPSYKVATYPCSGAFKSSPIVIYRHRQLGNKAGKILGALPGITIDCPPAQFLNTKGICLSSDFLTGRPELLRKY